MGISEGDLSEKAQFGHHCQDSYNAIIQAHWGPLPADKSQICWIGPRFFKMRLFLIYYISAQQAPSEVCSLFSVIEKKGEYSFV